MAEADHDVMAVLQRAPWFAGGTAAFLIVSTALFGVLYFSLIAGAVLGGVSLIFMLISFWKRKMLYQTLATVVVISGIVGMRAGLLPTLQTVSAALFVMTLPLAVFRPALARTFGHG